MDGNWESELFFFTIQFLLDACNFKLKPVTPLKFALLVKNTKYLAKTILHSVDFFFLFYSIRQYIDCIPTSVKNDFVEIENRFVCTNELRRGLQKGVCDWSGVGWAPPYIFNTPPSPLLPFF